MPDWNVPLKTDVYIRPISPTGPAGDEGGNYGDNFFSNMFKYYKHNEEIYILL